MTNAKMTWEESVKWLLTHPDKDKRDLARACYFDGKPLDAAVRFADSAEWDAVRDLLPKPPGLALDIGAGRGISSFALARDGWNVAAVEPDASALIGRGAIKEIIQESRLPIDIVSALAEELPYPAETFDVVHCRQALHHAADLRTMCREALRVLKKGGTLIATREHVLSRRADIEGFFDRHPLHFLYGGESAYTLDEYCSALQAPQPDRLDVYSPMSSLINLFPSSYEMERTRMARIIGIPPDEMPEYLFRLRDYYDQTPGRLYSFRVVK